MIGPGNYTVAIGPDLALDEGDRNLVNLERHTIFIVRLAGKAVISLFA